MDIQFHKSTPFITNMEDETVIIEFSNADGEDTRLLMTKDQAQALADAIEIATA